MRVTPIALSALAACLVVGCVQISQNGSGGGASTSTGTDGGTEASAEAGVQGAGCGIESGSGQQLCQATSLCPTVAVDTQAFPHCGFRIKGGSSELVCACGDMICSMGAFTTCTQAAALLGSQTEQQVCTQLAEGRCSAGAAAPSGSPGTGGSSASSSSSSSSGSSGNPSCDHTCLSECGGGSACASICGC